MVTQGRAIGTCRLAIAPLGEQGGDTAAADVALRRERIDDPGAPARCIRPDGRVPSRGEPGGAGEDTLMIIGCRPLTEARGCGAERSERLGGRRPGLIRRAQLVAIRLDRHLLAIRRLHRRAPTWAAWQPGGRDAGSGRRRFGGGRLSNPAQRPFLLGWHR